VLLLATFARAQDADWKGFISNDWDTGANWFPAVVPTGKASFGQAPFNGIIFSSASTSVDRIMTNAVAPAYSFTLSSSNTLTINDPNTAILSKSSNPVTFNNSGTLVINAGTIVPNPNASTGTITITGYDFHHGDLTIGPIAALQYTNVY
jgi:hypothetical protein